MARKYGWKPQARDARDVLFGAQHLRLPAAGELPPSRVLPQADVRDQGNTGSCTGQGVSNAIRIAALAAGGTCPALSALATYAWGRSLEETALTDDGASIRDVIKAAQKLGAADETSWPFDESKVNVRPDATAIRSAFDRLGVRGYYAIPVVTPLAVRQAIASGYPVVAGWNLGDGFENYDGTGVLTSAALGTLGGHCNVLDAYFADGTFGDLNSWGTSWGRAGRAVVDESFVEAAQDAWAVDVGAIS